MSAVIFCGPTITATMVLELMPSARVQPPAGCGDVYRVCRDESVAAIGLVDGYFDHRLSVWHKEILWALSRGIHVYGAASMGALRAAELAPLGMRGVGKIFHQFSRGELEDDDEVAVVHESRERGYAARSDAMVNLRETLRQAVEADVLSELARLRLVAELKALFYPLRTGAALAKIAREQLDSGDGQALLDWLKNRGIVDQKRLDAIEMAQRMSRDAGLLESGEPASRSAAPFEYTNAWHALRETVEREMETLHSPSGPQAPNTSAPNGSHAPSAPTEQETPAFGAEPDLGMLLEWVRVGMKEDYTSVLLKAVERAFALALAELEGAVVDPGAVQMESERFREERGLMTPEETSNWLNRYGMDLAAFSAFIYDNALSDRFAEKVKQAALRQLPSVLRNRGIGW